MYLQIWLPDVEVLNLKMFQALDVLSKLQGLWVSQNSDILYVLATRITFICAMSFDDFPLDTQTCLLQVSNVVNENFLFIIFSLKTKYNVSRLSHFLQYSFQVGSFNFDNRKMVFENYLMPFMPNHTKSILDYDVKIENLRPEATFFVPAETGKLWNIKSL